MRLLSSAEVDRFGYLTSQIQLVVSNLSFGNLRNIHQFDHKEDKKFVIALRGCLYLFQVLGRYWLVHSFLESCHSLELLQPIVVNEPQCVSLLTQSMYVFELVSNCFRSNKSCGWKNFSNEYPSSCRLSNTCLIM